MEKGGLGSPRTVDPTSLDLEPIDGMVRTTSAPPSSNIGPTKSGDRIVFHRPKRVSPSTSLEQVVEKPKDEK